MVNDGGEVEVKCVSVDESYPDVFLSSNSGGIFDSESYK